ncbi:MAG TPA: nicotinate-nucleotide adenylyltransferase [Rheinheimera sp.]|uniref:nicotinate-nucleotide adenylyltransferase n=1 Tax=Rheinheimera sp. TaxID=1869214 RepID=UPI000EBC842A|nr:nicotinate-nucleotide adenylyltransferase [Rheinheimera sp.]HCU67193.1 nicotinate-nucleotide adenylyltransferase [Rheinheimera sp.]
MALLGFYGGTFDPIHQGHLQLALYVQQHCQLEQLQLLPCHLPPHRAHPGVSSEHRAAMVELAIAPYPALKLNKLELGKQSPSYTVETLEILRSQHPNDTLCFVIGMDSLCAFTRWHRYQDILSLCHLLVCQRPGYAENAEATMLLQSYGAQNIQELQSQQAGKILLLQNPLFDISASQIRAGLQQNEPQQTPSPALQIPAVMAYIQQHGLYQV